MKGTKMEKGPSKRTHRQSEWHKNVKRKKWNETCNVSTSPTPHSSFSSCVCVCWGIRKHLPIHTAPLHMHIRIRDDDSQTIFIGKLYLFLLPKAECGQGGRGEWEGSGLGKFQHQQHFGRIYTRIAVRASVYVAVALLMLLCFSVCASASAP